MRKPQITPDGTQTVKTTDIDITAPQNWTLATTLFENASPAYNGPAKADAPVVLISSAAAMPRGFYAAFAGHLVETGAKAVLTYDYRGITGSAGDRKRWPDLHMKDWALLDFPTCAQWLVARYPDNPLVGMGHSYGGQALGLSGVAHLFERYATVATMSGYWRDLDEPYGVFLKTQIAGAAISKLLGYVPKWAGIGEAMPGSIFLNWAQWIRRKDYFFSDPALPEVVRFKDVELPYLSIGLTDDTWGTKKAINTFMQNYTSAQLRQIWLEPADSGPIGHFSFFRPRHMDRHWKVATDFILKGDWPKEEKP